MTTRRYATAGGPNPFSPLLSPSPLSGKSQNEKYEIQRHPSALPTRVPTPRFRRLNARAPRRLARVSRLVSPSRCTYRDTHYVVRRNVKDVLDEPVVLAVCSFGSTTHELTKSLTHFFAQAPPGPDPYAAQGYYAAPSGAPPGPPPDQYGAQSPYALPGYHSPVGPDKHLLAASQDAISFSRNEGLKCGG